MFWEKSSKDTDIQIYSFILRGGRLECTQIGNSNNNIFNNNSNRNLLKFANQSLLKSICLQKQNSRNIFNCSIKNKDKNVVNNVPQKLSEKSCNVVGKLIEKQNNISRNSRINYDKLIKSFEG